LALGKVQLNVNGKASLGETGKAIIDDGDAECCCGESDAGYIQAQMCSTGEAIDLWFVQNEDGTIETSEGTKELPFYFFENQCNIVPRDGATSAGPETLADDYLILESCCCEDDDIVWVFKWTAYYNCNTETWTGPTQDTRDCQNEADVTPGWQKVSVDANGCNYEYYETGYCCFDEEDPPAWPPSPPLTFIQDTCGCPAPPCDNYCESGGNSACGTERGYYDCPIFATWEIYATEGCGGKEGGGLLDGGGCAGSLCTWNQIPVDPDAATATIQFFCDTTSNCPVAGNQLKVLVTISYDPGTTCDGQTADFTCGDIIVAVGAMHGVRTFPLYRSGTSGTTEIGTVTYFFVC
jgi:hypothetical protein